MREIKFRGFGDSHWRYGSLVIKDYISICTFYEGHFFEYPVDIKTIGQYIGRKDDNDVEIYEGDIIKGHQDFNDFLGVITYNPKMCNFVVESFITKVHSALDIYWMKVIGNIYENPELIKSRYNEV